MYQIIEKMFEGEEFKSVFEVGCANGGLLRDIGGVVGGIDRHESDLQKSKDLFPDDKDNFILRDLTDVPWPVNRIYDIVFSVGTLMYLENPTPVIKEMMRIGRKVILAEPVSGESITDHHGLRRYHDYEKILKEFGEVEVVGEVNNKTIFKCQK